MWKVQKASYTAFLVLLASLVVLQTRAAFGRVNKCLRRLVEALSFASCWIKLAEINLVM